MPLRARWRHIILTTILGLVAGLFAARLLAEEWPATFAVLYEPVGAATAALLTALLLVSVWLAACRLARSTPDATPLLPLALLGVYVIAPTVNLIQARVLLAGSSLLILFLALRSTLHAPRSTHHASRFPLPASHFPLIGVTLLAFLLYLRTLAPGVIVGDAAEFQTVLPTLGIAHPTGYPFYTLLGWLATRVPFGEVAWRANLLSAICGALTVGVVYLIVERLMRTPPTPTLPPLGGGSLVAALAALTFAVTSTWWAQSVMAEIYALGTLLAALAVYFVLCWGERRAEGQRSLSVGQTGRGAEEQGNKGAEEQRLPPANCQLPTADCQLPTANCRLPTANCQLLLAATCVGLGLAHHRTIVLLVPALLAYVLLTDWRIVRRPRVWLPALVLLIAPLVFYAYFPLRWPALHGGQPMTWEQFQFLVLAQGYAPALRLEAILSPDRWGIYVRLAVEQFGLAGLALAAVGAAGLALRRPRAFVLTGLFYAATVLFGLAYFVPDVSVFFIPAHLVTALWIGCGLWGMAQVLRWNVPAFQRFNVPTLRRLVPVVGVTIAALLPLSLAWTNLPTVDLSNETAAQDWGELALSYPLGQNAVIICDVHRLAPLNYLAHGAGRRPDVETIMPDTEAQTREIIAQALGAGRPVYLARFVPGLESIYALRSVGPLVEVSPRPLTTPPPIEHPTDVVFGGTLRLLGYTRSPLPATRYTFYWQPTAPVGQNLHPRLRLVDAAGRVWAEEPGQPPVDGLYPTTAWPAGSIVPDYHELAIPPGTPPGDYRVQVRLVPPFAEAGLLTSEGTDAVTLDVVTVPPATAFTRQPDHEVRVRFGNLLLVGYDQDEAVRPGGRVSLTLYWRVLGPVDERMQERMQLVVQWVGSTGVWEETIEPASSRWQPGEVRQETLTVPVPLASQPTGPGQLWLGLRDARGNPVPVRPGWLASPGDRCPLGSLDVAGTPALGLANFDDKVLLLDAEVSPTALSPGENLRVTLRWECVGRITKDYTVFVHLLDAGERIYGQTDAQPIYGTRPTSTWREGETIADDVYTFPVAAGAPPGTYRLEVGLYDATTMTRLNVLGPDSHAVGDRMILPTTVEVR